MGTQFKYILYTLLGLAVLNIIFTFRGGANISKIERDLQSAKRSTLKAIESLTIAKQEIDTLQKHVITMQEYLAHIQTAVDLTDAERLKVEAHSKEDIFAAKTRIDSLKRILRNDSLQTVEIINLGKK